ncbi:MAG: integrase core domain-containing protein [Deltaproteobacteria bacterium]
MVSATKQELIRRIHYLKSENQVLRNRLPKTIRTTPEERRQLVKAAQGISKATLRELVSIVFPATLLRWINADNKPKSKKKPSSRKPGRPRTAEDIRALIVRIATETGWGYSRVRGELRKLGYRFNRQTARNVLVEQGIDPGLKRGHGTWDEFLKIHWHTLWQCDFFSKRVWTWRGPIDLYLLVFLHIGSRKAWVSSATARPDSAWVAQQARTFCMDLPDGDRQQALVVHDRDTKFTEQFRDILKAEGLRPKKLAVAAPNTNAFVERFGQTIQQECLDHFVVVGETHLNYIVREFLRYYHELRPHQGLGNVMLTRATTNDPPTETVANNTGGDIVCDEWLGGLLKSYRRAA